MKFEYSETQHLEDFDRVIRSHLKKGCPVRLNKPSERAVKKADRDPRIIAWRSSCAKYECISTEIKSSATENFDCERLRSAARNIALRAQDMAHYATPMMPDWTERDVTALRQVQKYGGRWRRCITRQFTGYCEGNSDPGRFYEREEHRLDRDREAVQSVICKRKFQRSFCLKHTRKSALARAIIFRASSLTKREIHFAGNHDKIGSIWKSSYPVRIIRVVNRLRVR